MSNEWIQLRVEGDRINLDEICAVMSMLDSGLMIEDYSDITTDGVYGDLIDESILSADPNRIAVSIFMPAEGNISDYVAFLRERLSYLNIDAAVTLVGHKEENWAHSWKKYYRPISVGRITIVPMWEDYSPKEGEIVVRMDPGMAFGTGTHETTRLVIALMEKHIKKGDRVLDIGCGSGILSICASKLGASFCAAYDIDPVAVRVARENIAASKQDNIICDISDLLESVDLTRGGYDIVLANIVADIIIKLAPNIENYMNPGASFIVSGIICERKQAVEEALSSAGFTIIEEIVENGWCAMLARL
ncbi:MAG: 50S ribosomal protein L11 methyltransferase [Clostridiales bacterium]|nr:50S ribosomal protein L11 methyltransferase [Clostridiales bacterium]